MKAISYSLLFLSPTLSQMRDANCLILRDFKKPPGMINKTEIFLEYKGLLFSMAYNMLGNIDAAEDIVQDTFLKWMEIPSDTVTHTKPFLVKIVTTKCINSLTNAPIHLEQYVD